ncbi:TPA: hypothetical protein DDW35_03485 [Candidatus Sumerlaeota bacterium]|nr:hypothetical protein [Candidatus Sumerlaeota bacterium]
MKRIYILLLLCLTLSSWAITPTSKPLVPSAKILPKVNASPLTSQTQPLVESVEPEASDDAKEQYAADVEERKSQLQELEADMDKLKEEMEGKEYEGEVLKEAGKILDAEVVLSKTLRSHIAALESGKTDKILDAQAKTHFAENAVDIAGMRFNLEYDLDDMKASVGKAANSEKFKAIIAKYREKGLEQIRLKTEMQKSQMQVDKLEIEKNALSDEFDATTDAHQKTGGAQHDDNVI